MKRIVLLAIAVLSLAGCAEAIVGLAPLGAAAASAGVSRLLAWDWRPPPSWEQVRAWCSAPAVAENEEARAWCAKVMAPPPEPGGGPVNFGVRE